MDSLLTADNVTPSQYLSAKVEATERFMVALMLVQVDRSRHDSMVRDLNNDYTHGTDGFLKTTSEEYSYTANHVPRPKQYKAGYVEAVAFLTSQDADQNKFLHIKCRYCQKMGHYASTYKAALASQQWYSRFQKCLKDLTHTHLHFHRHTLAYQGHGSCLTQGQ
eukprot:6710060-Ditylum_brightwellii.AAC.1